MSPQGPRYISHIKHNLYIYNIYNILFSLLPMHVYYRCMVPSLIYGCLSVAIEFHKAATARRARIIRRFLYSFLIGDFNGHDMTCIRFWYANKRFACSFKQNILLNRKLCTLLILNKKHFIFISNMKL